MSSCGDRTSAASLRRRLRRATLAWTTLVLIAGSAAANSDRRAVATRTPTPPRIDGKVDDEVWKLAEPIGEFVQVEPVEGAPPSEPSDIRFLFDAAHLYIGMRLYDSDPSGIIATSRERDATLEVDDRVELVLDTFHDQRSAFFFQINATGSKGDALVTDGGNSFNKPWDGIWEGEAVIDAEGWSAELAIPFKTLSFAENGGVWGLNLMRVIGRRREFTRWASPDRDLRFFAMANAGDLVGLEDMRQGVGLDVVPFFVSTWTNDQRRDEEHLLGEPGLDAFYKLTSNLTLSLTINTDFAETEVDERQVNLTRFPLFFPERRDFFLQDAGLFEFSDIGGVIPFFSRTIGLSDEGEEVPIVAGAKLTGRAGGYNIGVLDIQTEDVTGLDGDNLFVARVSKNVGEQSAVGGIVTHGNPNGSADNTVFGLDGTYRTNEFLGDKSLEAGVWGVEADSEGISSDEAAYGAFLRAPNDIWRWGMQFQEVQENFDPALGFVHRKDVRDYQGWVVYLPRVDEDVRSLEFSVEGGLVTDTNDVLETWEVEVQPFGINFESGDSARIELIAMHDELRSPFTIFDKGTKEIVIQGGEYDFNRWRLELDTALKRRFSASLAWSGGEFFDGDRVSYFADLRYRTGPLFTGSFEWIQDDVDLPDGSFTTRVARGRTRFSFSPALSWNTLLQWDNRSGSIGVNSGLRYIPKPGHDVYLVFNQSLEENQRHPTTEFQEVAVKVSYTVRL